MSLQNPPLPTKTPLQPDNDSHAGSECGHVSTHQVFIIQSGPVHQSERDACLSSSEGLRGKEKETL